MFGPSCSNSEKIMENRRPVATARQSRHSARSGGAARIAAMLVTEAVYSPPACYTAGRRTSAISLHSRSGSMGLSSLRANGAAASLAT